jgi:uncharacterized protein
MENEKIASIRSRVKTLLPEFGTHGYEHTERVYRACQVIGVETGADLDILLPAALLHDIARGNENHAMASAEQAKGVLKPLGMTQDRIEAITVAISAHSFSGGAKPQSLEAQILSDADKLDAMGALGVYRAAMYSAEHSRPISDYVAHFHEKLLTLKDLLHTERARSLAETRHEFMKVYLEQLEKELSLV